jgi:hypothetical protein
MAHEDSTRSLGPVNRVVVLVGIAGFLAGGLVSSGSWVYG